MRISSHSLIAAALAATLALEVPVSAKDPDKSPGPASLYDLAVRSLDGKEAPLAAYKGKVTLVVNTASQCGFTPQYAGLQKLQERYKDRGVVVLGFPSNDFGGQEPGTAAEIKTFCEARFHVTFPMFEKVKTRGDGQSAVYAFLGAGHELPKWNFHKYVVGKDGRVRASFPSQIAPQGKEIEQAIEAALAK